MGADKLTVYDFDVIEEHNFPNQLLPEILSGTTTIGMPKVVALQALVLAMTSVKITAKNERYTHQELNGIVISAVDSMTVRMQIFEKIKRNPSVDLFIDGRMSATNFQVYAQLPFKTELWEKSWFMDGDGDQTPCTAKTIIYNTMGIASEIANIIKLFINDEKYPLFIEKDYQKLTYTVGGI